MNKHILIIDDDIKLIELLTEYLEQNQFRISYLLDGRHALEKISDKTPDLIILDYMMPGKDGLEVLRDIRTRHDLPVIMLTARGDDTDKIVGLELGADDYLAKPFNPRELLARIKAILRRQAIPSLISVQKNDCILQVDGLVLNRAAHTVEIKGRCTDLSTTEFNILEVLMKNPNRVLSRDQIMNMAKGRDFMAFDRSIDIHISKLRSKIEDDPSSPKRIKTVWGSGYMLTESL
ncbi:MAG: two-component system response regulator OmpR [Desulfobacterales bacterium RIFOXYA12_FULL_46_15]|nr:MAG: two-component system response regulator OmpR [Desulfobacula sp. GWF2_41_7]OGR23040.1 MAG: two-component system response regulator OmpR [Desulfobacterales bacterium RIFOXYA12_FULL_46_15]